MCKQSNTTENELLFTRESNFKAKVTLVLIAQEELKHLVVSVETMYSHVICYDITEVE